MGILYYWITLIAVVIIALVIIVISKPHFEDLLIYMLTVCLALYFSIISTAFLHMYFYINIKDSLIYSTIYATFVYPSINYIYIVFSNKWKIAKIFYIILWSIIMTFLELFIVKPLSIVTYTGWNIMPWSPITYFLIFSVTSLFHEMIQRRLKGFKID